MAISAENEIRLLEEKKRILQVRSSFEAWCRSKNIIPAKHHQLIIKELESVVRGDVTRLMILMPPGTAKSTYISKLFPPWFLAQRPNLSILSCSHSGDFATIFGRAARNFVEGNERLLGYTLSKDSRAANEWETSNGCRYYCTGVGAGLSGHRADLGVIDDFVGKEEEVGSKTFNDKIWDWYTNDFVPRLKPDSARVIIANHRNEDDLVGRLLQKEASKWRVVRLRLYIENEEQAADDPLGRSVGEHIWPEFFTAEMVAERMQNPRASGIEQQEPSPEKGGFFQAEWFHNNTYTKLPPLDELRIYCASDHAVSEKQTADPTVIIPVGMHNGCMYVLPDVVWKRLGSKDAVDEMLKMARQRKPLLWWAERGHISKSILPFLQDRMRDEKVYVNIVEVTPVKDKMTRAQSISAMMSMGMVKWPADAPWLNRARHEMLLFPNGKHDDFVDAMAWLGMGVASMVSAKPRKESLDFKVNKPFSITMRDVKASARYKKRLDFLRTQDA